MQLIDKIFYFCVKVLKWLAGVTGTSYEFVNVVIFCFILPVMIIALLLINYNLRKEIKKYRNLYEAFLKKDMDNVR